MTIIFIQPIINLIYIEVNDNKPSTIAGFGIAAMSINVVFLTVVTGLNGALETLISQSYG